MIKYLDLIIKRAREERGLSQEALIQEIGEYNISVRTLRRIENGNRNVKSELVNVLLKHFDLDLAYKLRDEYEEKIAQEYLADESGCSIKECLEEISVEIMKYRNLFHGETNSYHKFPISSLPEFLIYLPLIDANLLFDSLYRIEGEIHGRFCYVLEQLEVLYKRIPDSDMKRIADELVKGIFDGGYTLTREDRMAYKQLLEDKMHIYMFFREMIRLIMDSEKENKQATES